MQQMPFQDFKCPTCNNIMNVRSIHGVCCPIEGCNWIEMIPIPHPMTMQPTTELPSWGFFEIGIFIARFFLLYLLYEAYLRWLS